MRSSIDPFFRPSSIAVIGASRSPGTIGYQIVHNLLTHGYTGVLYPVNPKAAAVHSVPAFPSIMDIPGPVELAVIAVPKERVLDVARECAKKGVKALVVISAGFREVGGAGVERERALVELTRRYYLLSYCSPARAGKHEVKIEAVADGSSGEIGYSFDAKGFTPGCDPGKPPPFSPSRSVRKKLMQQSKADDK